MAKSVAPACRGYGPISTPNTTASTLLAMPGFLSAGRYVVLKGGPENLAPYELETQKSAAHLGISRRGALAPVGKARRRIGGTIGRNYLINGYRQIFPMHIDPIEMTQGALRIGRIGVPSVVEDEFNDWYTPPIPRPIWFRAASARGAAWRSTRSRNT